VTLLKQQRAFMTEIMSTMTVLIKSIKSTSSFKFPMEKDPARDANLSLQISRGSWVSEILEC
jgi:hypothetical protein